MKKQKIKDFIPNAAYYLQLVDENGKPVSDNVSWRDLCDNEITFKLPDNGLAFKKPISNIDISEMGSNFDAFFKCISPKQSIYPFQSTLISEIEHNKNNLFIKARQLGITDILCKYIIWKMIFNPNICINYVSYNHDMSQMIKARIKNFFNSLPEIFTSFKYLNVNDTNISCIMNNSKLLFTTSYNCENNVRGIEKIDISIIDEASFICPTKLKNIIQTLQVNTNKFIFTYTVIPDSSCLEVIEDTITPLNVNVYRWYLIPNRTEEWKNRYIKNLGEESFRMGFECKLPEKDYD